MLKKTKRFSYAAFVTLVTSALLLQGCSGTPSDSSASVNPANLRGVAFSDSRCANVPVNVIAADGAVLNQTRTDDNGAYTASFANPVSNPARFVSASCPNADGGDDTLLSPIFPDKIADLNAPQTVNLNQAANFFSALLANSRDPGKLIAEVGSGVVKLEDGNQAAARDQLAAMLQPIARTLGLPGFDPVATPMEHEPRIAQLLQTVSIRFIPRSDGTRIVRIRLKLASRSEADGQPVFQVSNADLADAGKLQSLIALVSAVGVYIGDLAPSGTSALIDDLVARIDRCAATYPLPIGDIEKTKACAAMFVDGDKANYLNDGLSYFNVIDEKSFDVAEIESAQQPVSYSAPAFEYLRPNGILGITVRRQSADTLKTLSLDTRIGADGKLGLSGNQYRFNMSLMAHAERRSFLHQPSSDYLSTGYRMNIPLQGKHGEPITKVIVTPPASLLPNTAFTLLAGANEMVLARQDAALNETADSGASAFVRMRSEYVDASIGQRHPSLRDIAQYFIKSDIADATIAAIAPNTQVWKAEFYVGASATPDVAQYYRVPARPLTIAELSQTTLPDLAPDTRDMLKAMLIQDNAGVGITPLAGRPALTLSATGASPVYLSVHGSTTSTTTGGTLYFRDVPSFPVYVTSDLSSPLLNPSFAPRPTSPGIPTTVPCASGINGDAHCASKDNYVDSPLEAALMTGVELKAYPAYPVEKARFLSVQQLLP
jgi:hypothetical protein